MARLSRGGVQTSSVGVITHYDRAMMKFLPIGRLHALLIRVRSSLWFVPTGIVLFAIVLAFLLIELDQIYDDRLLARWPRLFASEAEGARGVLSAIAGSMATVTGVVFSITIVALTVTSTQYTPRVLRNFMRDRANQVVLGVFVGVWIYCLLVMRTISNDEWKFVPALAVMTAVLLAIIASGFLIFFIHHISSTIQASEITASITRETLHAIDKLFPDQIGDKLETQDLHEIQADQQWHPVAADTMGYIQGINLESLLAFACDRKTVVRLESGIGEFIAPGRPLASLAMAQPPDAATCHDLNSIFAVGTYRTIDQDPAFGIRQLVDIALKALSPGINDTTTAVSCIEHIGVILTRFTRCSMAAPCRYDGNTLRVIACRTDYNALVGRSFSQILECAGGNSEIHLRLLLALEQIAHGTSARQRLAALRLHVRHIEQAALRSLKADEAIQRIQDAIRRTDAMLDARELHKMPKSFFDSRP